MDKDIKQGRWLRGTLIQSPLWVQLMSSLLFLGELACNPSGWCL